MNLARTAVAAAFTAAAIAMPTAAQAAVAPKAAPAATITVNTSLRPGQTGPAVVALQKRLNQLGYWVGPTGGTYGTNTTQAVMALQKAAGLGRDGVLGAKTRAALNKGVRPVPRSKSGHVIEVDKARQIMIVADNGRTTRIYNVSTGGEYRYTSRGRTSIAHTPSGQWRVYRTVRGWETGPLGSLYRSHYVVGGIAIHGIRNPAGVGAYGASHGCVRMTMASMDELVNSRQVRYGTTVRIY